MKGQKFLKITGILMIIAAVFSILAGVLVLRRDHHTGRQRLL